MRLRGTGANEKTGHGLWQVATACKGLEGFRWAERSEALYADG